MENKQELKACPWCGPGRVGDMKKTFKQVSKESKAKWDKGLKQLRDAIVEPIEGGFIPPDVRTFEAPLTECEKEGAVDTDDDCCNCLYNKDDGSCTSPKMECEFTPSPAVVLAIKYREE